MTPNATPGLKVVHRCPACVVGYVIPTSKDGRFFTFRETVINLPMSIYIPTCGLCQARFPTSETHEEIMRGLETEYQRDAVEIVKTLERLRRRKGNN